MVGPRRTRLSVTVAAVTAFGLSAAGPVATAEEAAGETIEEIVVTGSFIRRDSFDSSTPVDVLDEVELAEQGTPNLGDVLRNSTYNFGVESVGNILAANPQTAGLQQANFRGLGANATLTLLDGKRVVQGNLANTYPQIMIDRVESLTDGGATLYGTDAVGGVLNIIPKKSFEGFEIMASTNQADDYHHNSYSFIWGASGDRASFVISGERREQGALNFYEREEYYLGAASYSSTSWPGDFVVANRDATGAITNTSTRPDPGCGVNNPDEVNGVPLDTNGDGVISQTERKAGGLEAYRQGFRVGSCRWEFGANFDYFDKFTADVLASNFDFEWTDSLSVSGEIMWTRRNTNSRGSPSNPGGRIPELTAIPGENPGNPYRAFVDVDVDGVYDPDDGDALLYAQDADGDGVPDRGNQDLDNNGLMDVIVAGTDPAGGIPFNEDVIISDWRPVGYPFFGPSRLNDDRTSNGAANGELRTFRAVTQFDYDINENWSGFTSVLWSELVQQIGGRAESLSAIQNGLNGTLLVRDEENATSRPAWFNPFTTQNYACVNRDCSGGNLQTDPAQINFTDVYDQIAYDDPPVIKSELMVIESVMTGDIVDMPAGVLQTAFGFQIRDESYAYDGNIVDNALDVWIGVGAPDYKEDRQTYALFGEFRIPLLDTLEVDASVRHEAIEDASPSDLDHTDFRLGVHFTPLDSLAIRGSYSTAFIAPNLPQLYNPPTLQGLSQVSDPFLGTSAFVARTTGGTPTLRPEEADIYNLGFTTFFFDDNLRIDFDYKYFDFKDRIIRPAAQEVLLDDAAQAQAAGYTLDAAGLAGWVVDPANPQVVSRSPTSGDIQLVLTDQINAQSMKWEGFDLSVNYSLPTDLGEFQFGFDSTYTLKYDYTSISGVTTEGAGKRNNNTAAVPPTPELRANIRGSWTRNIHNVTMFIRYMSEVEDVLVGDPFAAFCGAAAGAAPLFGINSDTHCAEKFDSFTTVDLQYTLALDNLFGGNMRTTVQVGAINLFDEEAQPSLTLGGLETFLYDPRNRQWYVRLRVGF